MVKLFDKDKQIEEINMNGNHFLIKGVSRYSKPFSFISYNVANSIPNLPAGKPFWLNHTRYDSGKRHNNQPWYLPKGILVLAKATNISGFKLLFSGFAMTYAVKE